TALGLAIFFGRYWLAIPVLAIAGALAQKKTVPPSAGTLPTHTPLFVALLVGVVILVGALTYVPALALGPIVEPRNMIAGREGASAWQARRPSGPCSTGRSSGKRRSTPSASSPPRPRCGTR